MASTRHDRWFGLAYAAVTAALVVIVFLSQDVKAQAAPVTAIPLNLSPSAIKNAVNYKTLIGADFGPAANNSRYTMIRTVPLSQPAVGSALRRLMFTPQGAALTALMLALGYVLDEATQEVFLPGQDPSTTNTSFTPGSWGWIEPFTNAETTSFFIECTGDPSVNADREACAFAQFDALWSQFDPASLGNGVNKPRNPEDFAGATSIVSWLCNDGPGGSGGTIFTCTLGSLHVVTETDPPLPLLDPGQPGGPLSDEDIADIPNINPRFLPDAFSGPDGAPDVSSNPDLADAGDDMADDYRDAFDGDPATVPDSDPAEGDPGDPEAEATELPELTNCDLLPILCDIYNFLVGPGELTPSPTLPVDDVGGGITPVDVGLGPGSCPAPVPVSVQGGSISIPFDMFCDLAIAANPFLMAAASVMAGFIVVGGVRR